MPAFQLCFYLLPKAEPAAAPGKNKKKHGHWKQDTTGSDTAEDQRDAQHGTEQQLISRGLAYRHISLMQQLKRCFCQTTEATRES